MAWDCSKYFDFLFDQAPHYDDEVLRDWYPTDDAWIGRMKATAWEPFTGTEHVYDHVHIGAPDLSQAWTKFDTQSADCTAGACAPPEISVGWGSTRKVYDRERISYTTNVLCFDQINTRAKAKEQASQIVEGIKEITKMVQSDYMRRNALQMNDTIFICGKAMIEVPITSTTFTGAALTMDIGGAGNLPTSALTIEYLQRFYAPLEFKGYFKGKFVPAGMFNLITDIITSQQLTDGNPALTSMYKFTDFQTGGELFKYGMKRAIGNFGISWDTSPMRFYWDAGAGLMRRVFPWVNVPATIGIKAEFTKAYELAPYQVSFIWHPEACERQTPYLTQVNPAWPFMVRDLMGKWQFFGGNRDKTLVVKNPTTGTSCTIDNKRGNQGLMWADFENAIKFKYPQWTRAILHLRDPGCVNDQAVCPTAPSFVSQNHSDTNPVCPILD